MTTCECYGRPGGGSAGTDPPECLLLVYQFYDWSVGISGTDATGTMTKYLDVRPTTS